MTDWYQNFHYNNKLVLDILWRIVEKPRFKNLFIAIIENFKGNKGSKRHKNRMFAHG